MLTPTRVVNAKDLVDEGNDLVGTCVYTYPYGKWEGGNCVITKVAPDPSTPRIVFQVLRTSDNEDIGVFGDEDVIVMEESNGRCNPKKTEKL